MIAVIPNDRVPAAIRRAATVRKRGFDSGRYGGPVTVAIGGRKERGDSVVHFDRVTADPEAGDFLSGRVKALSYHFDGSEGESSSQGPRPAYPSGSIATVVSRTTGHGSKDRAKGHLRAKGREGPAVAKARGDKSPEAIIEKERFRAHSRVPLGTHGSQKGKNKGTKAPF